MSLKAYEWASKTKCPDATCKLILLQFASFHNQKTGQCNPSNASMIERTQLDPKTFKSGVRRLEACGLLGWFGSKSGGRSKSIMRVLNAPESAGVKAFSGSPKGTKTPPPFKVIKGGNTQTPFSGSAKGDQFPPPDNGTTYPIGEGPIQELKVLGGSK
ncbi:MAG: hypothetical protein CML68_13600 [Rhodobacteraceae bacterium]|nr:hypothetical protein [Paracoccaceae bacterium]